MPLTFQFSIIQLARRLSNNAKAPSFMRVKLKPSCSVSVYSREAMVASGVRSWGEMSYYARARAVMSS